MSKKYLDEFVKLPVSKMAQKISDMTYAHEKTEVPTKHYKKLLEENVLEMMAQDSTMHLVLLNAILGQLNALKKESPTLFLKAFICMDKGIKVDNINQRIFDSLDSTVTEHVDNKFILSEKINESYETYFEEHASSEKDDRSDIENGLLS